MATTTTFKGLDLACGASGADTIKAYLMTVYVTGTYETATKPAFDVLAALQAQYEPVTAVSVKAVTPFRAYRSGATVYDASTVVLSGTGNKTATFRVDNAGSEIADATALDGYFSFLVVVAATGNP